jgi:hypothetical protein
LSRDFDDPILLPRGRQLVTLRDAALYITKLSGHASPEWQAAMEALLLVAEVGGPTMFARIGVSLQPPAPPKRGARLRLFEFRPIGVSTP